MESEDLIRTFLETQEQTHFVKERRNVLYTFGHTRLPYIFLGDSAVNQGDVVMRCGEVTVEPPSIITPGPDVAFEGFEFEGEAADLLPVLLNRWVRFPAARYQNSAGVLEVVDGPLEAASDRVLESLDSESDIRTGVIQGPEATWGFSIIGYVGRMIVRSAPSNIGEYFERRGRPPQGQ